MWAVQWLLQIAFPVVSGLLVIGISTGVRAIRARTRIPDASTQQVNRRHYLKAILRASEDEHVRRLDAMVPNLVPAANDPLLGHIQDAWQAIDKRGGARIITREDKDCLTAGAELLDRGVEVRVGRSLNTDGLSFHVYRGDDRHSVVVNRRDGKRDRPHRLGLPETQVFQSHFDQAWDEAVPLESVLAEQVLRPGEGVERVRARMHDIRTKYGLGAAVAASVTRHVAFRHAARVVFLTGLPGAGKSTVRRLLAAKLRAHRFQVDELTDYLYAYYDHVHRQLSLGGPRGEGFTPHAGGAFHVPDERHLEPALQSLSNKVWESRSHTRLTLVEFARSDLRSAFQVFGDELLASAQVLHVAAPARTRSARLADRMTPPRVSIVGQEIVITPSDDHQLPSTAARSLYATDDPSPLRLVPALRDRVHHLDNAVNDPGLGHVDRKLDEFIENVVRPYKAAFTVTAA